MKQHDSLSRLDISENKYLREKLEKMHFAQRVKQIPFAELKGDSLVLHRASCNAHKNHVIRGMSARAFRERGIVFQFMEQVRRSDGL